MNWKLKWILCVGGTRIPGGSERKLRSLQECKIRLRSIRRAAEENGLVLLDAYAMPEMGGGTVCLAGSARGAAKCGVL